MQSEDNAKLVRLIRERRWAALGTLRDNGEPYVSFVAYAAEPDFSGFLIHLSLLAPHTQHILSRSRVSLGISESDAAAEDPQQLGRVTIQGGISEILRETSDYRQARTCYLAHLPEAERLFGFGDFKLFRIYPEEARYVGGFARTRTWSAEQLRNLAQA